MPGQHNTEKFKFIGLWLNQDFLAQIDRARGEMGRSQFLRDALASKLSKEGFYIMRDKVIAPDRAGKGGPVTYRIKRRQKNLKEP
jgi:hypothetical protein